MTRLLLNDQLYKDFILKAVPETKRFLWIATADIKNMHFEQGKRFVPFLKTLSDLVEQGREVRLLHAKEPGPRFRMDFDSYPSLVKSDRFERILCPRVHFKSIIIDGVRAYTGSANFTGAGMGAKNQNRRNFEAGVDTSDPLIVRGLMDFFDDVFLGRHCTECSYLKECPDPANRIHQD
ncbi:MAG: phospholipase D-like domain-containing protein [Spirochaetia bacterium]|nr:phospholipase D-like domain-containing protein [Spirochaetia bacterium]